MRMGLAVYGTTFGMGIHPASGRAAISPEQLLDMAISAGLEGVELPASWLPIPGWDAVGLSHWRDHRVLDRTITGIVPGDATRLGTAIGYGG
jgi:hypothetical protein